MLINMAEKLTSRSVFRDLDIAIGCESGSKTMILHKPIEVVLTLNINKIYPLGGLNHEGSLFLNTSRPNLYLTVDSQSFQITYGKIKTRKVITPFFALLINDLLIFIDHG